MRTINSCVAHNVTQLEYFFELLKSSDCSFNLFQLISVDDKELIKKILSKKIICYSELCFDLLKIYFISLHKMILCGLSKDIFNIFVHSYLSFVINNSHRNEYFTQFVYIYSCNAMQKLSFEFLTSVNTFNILNFESRFANITKVVALPENGCEPKVLSGRIIYNLSNIDKDYQSFLIPLEQDYTKSSRGYCSKVITISNEANVHTKSRIKCSKDRLIADSFYNIVELTGKNAQKTQKGLCYADIFYSTIIKASHHDSESDESIIFLEDKETVEFENSVECDSDSDESIVFSENLNTKLPTTKLNALNNDLLKEFPSLFVNSMTFDSCSNDYEILIKQNKESSECNFSSSEDSENDDDWNTDFSESETAFCFKNMYEPFDVFAFQNQPHFSHRHMTGSGFINPCFEDEIDSVFSEFSNIKIINDKWNDSMKNITSEPHESKRVSFVPSPDLVSVHSYEADDDDYQYSLHVLNQLRFQNRISEFEPVIAPYLTPEHRAKVFNRNYYLRR